MALTEIKAAVMLEKEFGSLMYISEDGLIIFSIPAKAMKKTVLGDSHDYWIASALMFAAEMEHKFQKTNHQQEGGGEIV